MLKYFIYASVICLFTISCGSTAQPSYTSYAVKQGETVYSIAEDNNISADVIYNLNPDSKNGLKANSIIILPSKEKSTSAPNNKNFREHKVKKKETLYGIGKMYNVSVEDIKKLNKDLYSRGLKKGETLYIPILSKDEMKNPNIGIPPGTQEYTVKAKETKFGIARQFGISIAELEDLNPNLEESLPIGSKLIVPEKKVIDSGEIDTDNFEYYEVQPKEGFYRLKVKFGLSEEDIIALNPYAKDGLIEGMILKLPKTSKEKSEDEMATVDLVKKIENKKMKNVALMLPFRLAQSGDSTSVSNEDQIKRDPTLRIALDFYSGALMAAEFAKDNGIPVTLSVYDTEKNDAKLASIVSQRSFDNVDAVIGPLLQKNVEKTSLLLEKRKIPVFSPLSNREMNMNSNLFQTLPTNDILEKSMVQFLKQHSSGRNIIIIADPKHASQRERILAAIPTAKIVSFRKDYLKSDDVSALINEGMENWVVLSTENPVLVSSSVNVLAGMPGTYKLRLFTLDKNDAYEWNEVSSVKLAKLDFTFPSVTKSSSHSDNEAFVVSYKNKYGVIPNKYAMRGFDVTYDVLLRMASDKNVYDAFLPDRETSYIDNKFRYEQTGKSGYSNQAAFILKYDKDLKFEIVEK